MKILSKLLLVLPASLGVLILTLPATVAAISLPNPIKGKAAGGSSTVVDIIIGGFYGFLTLIAVFGLGFLIVSGFRLILARDNPEAITAGKNAVMWSILGLGLSILSVTVILSINTLLGGSGVSELDPANQDKLQIPLIAPKLGPAGTPVAGFAGAFVQIISNIAALAFIVCALMLIWAGYQMVFSAGNEEKITASRTIIIWALAGMAVIILSYLIVFGLNRLLENLPNAGGFRP